MKCDTCPHGDSPYVQGSGNKKCCKIMIIGTSPGSVEETTGEAFTGKSGQLVRDVTEYINIQEDTYFTNVIKRKPKREDGTPKKATMADCQMCGAHLLAELIDLEPTIVITLGQLPLKFMMPAMAHTISQIHGLPISMQRFNHHFILIPSFDPSFVQRRGGLYSEIGDVWLSDLLDAKAKLEDVL